jgi:hypothetical protein
MEKINDSNVVTRQKDESNALRLLERQYVLNHFKDYVKRHSYYTIEGTMHPNYIADIMTQVIIYTDGLFTLPQLFFLYKSMQSYGEDWSSEGLYVLKHDAVNWINKVAREEDDLGDIKSFLKKILSTNPIVFNALIYLIYDSHLFWDYETEDYIYPEFENFEKQLKSL